MPKLWIKPGVVLCIAAALCLVSAAGRPQAQPSSLRQITSVTIKNSGKVASAQRLVSLGVAFQTGDVPQAARIQIARSDGSVVATAQEDRCSLWRQDNSRKVCAVSFFDAHPFRSGQSTVYRISSVSGSPDRATKLSVAAILAKTDIVLKTSDLSQAQGKKEDGDWDL